MKKSSVYTRRGDSGETSLADGTRVAKDSLRLEAYGTLDELSAQLGLLATAVDDEDREAITAIQNRLFTICAILATPSEDNEKAGSALVLGKRPIEKLEQAIDSIDAQLEPLRAFILSGGCTAAALAHVCRTTCRRAERLIVTLSRDAYIDEDVLRYVNRLSDYLFVFARLQNKKTLTEEKIWKKVCD